MATVINNQFLAQLKATISEGREEMIAKSNYSISDIIKMVKGKKQNYEKNNG